MRDEIIPALLIATLAVLLILVYAIAELSAELEYSNIQSIEAWRAINRLLSSSLQARSTQAKEEP